LAGLLFETLWPVWAKITKFMSDKPNAFVFGQARLLPEGGELSEALEPGPGALAFSSLRLESIAKSLADDFLKARAQMESWA
jgi:hypothetical protein